MSTTTSTTPRTGYRDYTVVGTAEHLRNVITNHHTAGTLVSLTAPTPNSPTDPRLRLTLRVRTDVTPTRPKTPTPRSGTWPQTSTARTTRPMAPTRPTATSRPRRRTERRHRDPMPTWRRWLIAVAGLVVVGVIAGLAYLIWLAITFIADNALTIVGFLAIAAIAGAALYGGSGRRHCPGC